MTEEPAKKQPAAFFDVDNTLVRGSTAFLYAKVALEIGVFKRTDVWRMGFEHLRFIWRGENNDRLAAIKDQALSLIAGASREEMHSLMQKVWDKEIKRKVYPGMVELLQQHLQQGREVWLITASPQELADLIAKNLGATGALGTEVEHKDGFMTGRLVGQPLHGAEKANAAKKIAKKRNLSLRKSWAYSDSRNDLPLLTLVKHPVAVNPDQLLKRHALAANWQILNFSRKDLREKKR